MRLKAPVAVRLRCLLGIICVFVVFALASSVLDIPHSTAAREVASLDVESVAWFGDSTDTLVGVPLRTPTLPRKLTLAQDAQPRGMFAASSHALYYTEGTTLHRRSESGSVEILARLPGPSSGVTPDSSDARFDGFLAVDESQAVMFATVRDPAMTGQLTMIRFELGTGDVESVPINSLGFSLDSVRDELIEPSHLGRRVVRVWNFSRRRSKEYSVTSHYGNCRALDEDRLLLSGHPSLGSTPIAILFRTSGKEIILPVEGFSAVHSRDRIYYLDSRQHLLSCNVSGGDIRLLARRTVPREGASGTGWGPQLSTCGRLLAWQTYSDRFGMVRAETVLLDTRTEEFVRVPIVSPSGGPLWSDASW